MPFWHERIFLFRFVIWKRQTNGAKQLSSFSKMAMSFVLTTRRHLNNAPQACGGVCMLWLERFAYQLPERCRCSIYSRSKSHHDYTAHREQWLIHFLKSIQHLRPFTATYNNLRPLLLLVVIFAFWWCHFSNNWKSNWAENISPLFFVLQLPKLRNVFNMDFPDSNHLSKTLTIVSGPDTVNLTYHNFFACKEKVTQVINCFLHRKRHFALILWWTLNPSFSCVHRTIIFCPLVVSWHLFMMLLDVNHNWCWHLCFLLDIHQNWANDVLALAYNAARNNACRQVFLEKMWANTLSSASFVADWAQAMSFAHTWQRFSNLRYVRISLHTNKDGKIPVKK